MSATLGAAIVAARHAAVAREWRGRCYGRTDVTVEVAEEEAARRVQEGLRGAFDAVWSSPLARCHGPARIGAEALGLEHRVDVRLQELDHGRFEGRSWDEIHAAEPEALARWGERWIEEGPPGGESARALELRVAAWADGLQRGTRHLLIAHAGPVRALRVHRSGIPWQEAMGLEVPHLAPVAL
ncbi:MAG: histidine phosphatase family protein [Planctomycetota bacterium]|nr:histidine phosphatase family protein [Planctomycetota bacterium]